MYQSQVMFLTSKIAEIVDEYEENILGERETANCYFRMLGFFEALDCFDVPENDEQTAEVLETAKLHCQEYLRMWEIGGVMWEIGGVVYG